MNDYLKLIKELRLLCTALKEEEEEAKRLITEKPEYANYFTGMNVARMQSRIELETLIEKFGAHRPSTADVTINLLNTEPCVIDSVVAKRS